MAVEEITQTIDGVVSSTSADENFILGSGEHTINFDLSNNNVVGEDTIELTAGEDLILNFTSQINFSSFNEYNGLITWERTVNDHDGIDIVIKTRACHIYGYAKVVTTITDEIVSQSSYYTYYKSNSKYYLYDYENNEWVLNKTTEGTALRDQTSYGQCYVDAKTGLIDSPIGYYNSSDLHENYAEIDGTVSGQTESENVINTITIKDVGAKIANSIKLQYTNPNNTVKIYQEYINSSYQDVNFITKVYDIGLSKYEGIATESQTLQGSFLDETFRAGYGDDIINTVGGTNTVNLYNGGNDVITLGAGADTVDGTFAQGQAQGHYEDLGTNTVANGGVTIINGDSQDTLKLSYDGDNYFYKNNDDLVIIQNYLYNNGYSRLSKFTIEDYFNAEKDVKNMTIKGGIDYSDYSFSYKDNNTITATRTNDPSDTKDVAIGNIIQNEGTIEGTNNSEAIIATAQSTITTGDGDDTIYTTSENDTIIIDGSGAKTIVIDTNSGIDTIDIQNTDATVYIDILNVDKFKFYKDKDENNKDLIIERIKEDKVDGVYTSVFSDKTIIKNYFDTSIFTTEQKQKVFIRDVEHNSSAYWIHIPIEKSNVNSYIPCYEVYIEGDDNVNNTIAGTDHKDRIIGSSAVDTITTGKGEDIIIANKGDDIININDTGTKTIRFAKGDGNDTINLSGNALVDDSSYSYLNLSYTDGAEGISYQINDDKLTIYGTRVDGDIITTDSVTIDGITGGDVTAENIANYESGLNIANKIRFYKDYMEYNSYYGRWDEKSSYLGRFEANTPYYVKGSGTINATNTSNLVEGGSGVDNVNAVGQINKIFSGAGDDKITVNSTESATVYAGSGDDEINIESGVADIYPGSGADVINIKGGTGGTLNFTAGEGDKTVNFIGAKDAQYNIKLNGYQSFTNDDYTTCKKDGNNFIIEIKYYDSEEAINKTETLTFNNFFASNHCKIDPNNTIIYYSSSYTNLKYVDLNIIGQYDSSKNATVFEGTVCEDIIEGTSGVDEINLSTNYDKITAGKGDDIITIKGLGDKSFYYSKGDGDDIINIADEIDFTTGNGYINFYDKDYSNRPEKYAYTIQDNDLTIYRIYNNNGNITTDSTTIKGIKGVNDETTQVTIDNIKNSDGGLNISGRLYAGTYWSNVAKLTKGSENESNIFNTTTGTTNTVTGGNKADDITLNGSNDTIYAGAGNDTITSNADNSTIYAGEGDDKITLKKGNNTVYTGAGNDEIIIEGGQGTIYLTQGSGKNTLTFKSNNEDGTCHLDGVYNINFGSGSYGWGYNKSGDDLIVTRNDDTLTIKGLFGDNQLSDGNNLKINGSTISSMTVAGNYDKKQKATVFSGSNYGDNIYGTKGKDIITTGGGNDNIYTGKGNDTIIIDGSGNKYIYYEDGGNNTIQLTEGVSLGNLYLYNNGKSHVSSYKIDKNGNLILYRTYIDGDKFTTESTTIKGITGGDVTYDNIRGYGSNFNATLNITDKIKSGINEYEMNQGNFKKANKLSTTEGTSNMVIGGKKNDTIILNGSEDKTYTGAGADKITTKGNIAEIHAGSGNDTITLNCNNADIYGGKGNDKIYANGTGRYNFYGEKGDGNDTIILGKDFNQRMYFYNSGISPTQSSYKIDKNNNLILYRTYVDGDNITTDSVKITGIKGVNGENVDVNFSNIQNSSGGLNISGSYISNYNKNMVQGSNGKANKLTTKEGTQNVVIGGKKKDTVTLNGNDYAYTGKGNDTITVNSQNSVYTYAGSGNDTINVKNGYNYIYSGKGKDKINISGGSGYIYLKAGEGNDTITFSGEDFGEYRLYFEGYNSYNNYYKNGNDLLIKCTYKDAKGKTKSETHTIKDYFANEAVLKEKLMFRYDSAEYCLSRYGVNIVGKYDKKKKATIFNGTDYKDAITGTNKKDIIYTGDGSDKITAGKGDDEIIINGSQIAHKYVYLNNGDGNDIIKWAEDAQGFANLIINPNDVLSYEKSDRNLIITRSYKSGNLIKSEKTTIENFYDENGNPITYNISGYEYQKVIINDLPIDLETSFNRANYTTSTFDVENNYEFATGTKNADTVNVTADNSSVFTLAGDDTINVNSAEGGITHVAGGSGADTINLNTTGNVFVQHQSGDGNDTINFGENTPSRLTLSFESPAFNNLDGKASNRLYAVALSGKFGFKKSGNDLIVSVPVTSKTSAKTETITLTDYFNSDVAKPETYLAYTGSNYLGNIPLTSMFERYGIWTEGTVSGGVTTYTGLDGYKNHYEYKGTGKTIINGSDEQDYYLVNINSKSNLYINDAGGSGYSEGDTMCINTSYKNLRALFNMSADGQVIVSNEDTYSDNFMLFNKGSLTYDNIKNIFNGKDGKGVINIDNFYSETTDYSSNGVGVIESIYAQKDIVNKIADGGLGSYNYSIQQIHPSLWVEDLGSKVASWLTANTDGSRTAFEIFESGTKAEITALLKVYNTAYDTSFST